MATVSLKNLRKSFGSTDVIHGIDIDIDDGEFIVIVGPSGCGKSTLLRMVAGLEGVTDGEVLIDGNRVNEQEPMDRNIAMVFQNYALYPHMSVFDNMAYGLKIAKVPKPEIADRVAEAARLLQLQPYLKRRPRELSGGQRQRVAMGRAIVRRPAVFLFDEPLSNLDAKLRVQMRLEIKDLQRKLGVTALYVTHDQVEAMTMADRMIVMNGGVADQIGAPLEVYSNPQTAFVAGFIGSPPINLFDPALLGMTAPDGAQLGIRPEQVEVAQTNATLTGRLLYAEPLGAETLLHLALSNNQKLTVRQDGAEVIPDTGADVGLTWDSAAQLMFDVKGKRTH